MEEIKKAVVQTLEKQGVIAQLKAQLRAQVFLAVEEYDGLASKTVAPARNSLLSEADGQLAVQLVLDLLDTCNFEFTKRVFQPELGSKAPDGGRQAIAQTLGLKPSSADEALLVTLVKAFKAGSSAQPVGSSTPTSVPPASARPVDSSSSNNNNSSAKAPPSQPAAPGPPPPASVAPVAASSPAPVPAPRAGSAAAPLPRLEPLSKPTLAPLPALGPSAAKQPHTTLAASKPQPEPSAGDTGYDDDFEDVEDDVDAIATGDDDDDLAAALGCMTGSGPQSKDPGDGGRERLGAAGFASSSSRGRTALDADLMAGDRSFGVSNELAGLDVGNSGGLSYSADFPGGPSDMRGSLSSSQALLSPGDATPKVAKLEPLKPIGSSKLSPLAPLAPLPSISASLTSSKDDPLGSKGPKPLGPLAAPVRKSLADIEKEKEEMRRLVMLQSGESLSNSVDVEDEGGRWGTGPGGGGSREDRTPLYGSKGLSMDLGATGLSASDRSGDIEHMGVDLAETAEWH